MFCGKCKHELGSFQIRSHSATAANELQQALILPAPSLLRIDAIE